MQGFKRGMDIKESLSIGMTLYRDIKKLYEIKAAEDIYDISNNSKNPPYFLIKNIHINTRKNEVKLIFNSLRISNPRDAFIFCFNAIKEYSLVNKYFGYSISGYLTNENINIFLIWHIKYEFRHDFIKTIKEICKPLGCMGQYYFVNNRMNKN